MDQTGIELAPMVEDNHQPQQQQQQTNSIPGTSQDGTSLSGNEIVEEEQQPHQQHGEINNNPVASQADTRRVKPERSLVEGSRETYLKIGVPLYEASIRCNWKAAKAILDKKRELVTYSITDHGETALHVAASAKGNPKDVKEFVKNLVGMMTEEELALENESFSTALYLAAVAGNLETVKIMAEKNMILLTIPGGNKKNIMPLYAAALCGHYDVVKYLYEKSNELCDAQGWTKDYRGWLLERCVENDMFDIALEIVKRYPDLDRGSVLRVLARKPEAFHETQSNIIEKTIKLSKYLYSLMFITHQPSENKHLEAGNMSAPEEDHREAGNGSQPPDGHPEAGNGSAPEEDHLEAGNGSQPPDGHPEPGNGSAPEHLALEAEVSAETKTNSIGRTIKSVFPCIGLKVGGPQKESNALLLLRFIWDDIAKKPKKEIDSILKGPADSVREDNKTVSGWAIQAMQLQKLIFEHVDKMNVQTTTNQDTRPASAKEHQAMRLQSLISDHLVELHAETQKIIKLPPNSIKQDNQPVSSKGDQALQLQSLVFKHIANMNDETQKIIKSNISLGNKVSRLRNVISEHTKKMRKETQDIIVRKAKETHSSRVLFIAAEMGNTNFLVELIRQYPDLIWKVNDDNQTIFHIAVKHRQEGVYNLLYEIGAMKDLITPLKDPNDNNMLHLVVNIVKQKRLEDVPGVALQIQRELLWFNEVKNMIPPSYRERKNKDGLTPHELFRMEHKELVIHGEKWMKGTANRCMVVAALIATIVFAAAFTVPGGYSQTSQTTGIPVFHSKATFMVFVVADAISLFLSSASILIFLSILTSRYAESDFLESLPKKLISGLLTLFLSIATMTVSFGVSFFVLYHKGLLWMPILICVFAIFPVILYIWLQYGLFFDVIRSTYRSRYLFKPEKHVLYYNNPKV